MLHAALALLLAASPPAGKARELASSGSWEELYLAFSSARPSGYSRPDARTVAAALLAGCRALEATDAVMAFSLGERSAAFQQTPGALLCLARAALKVDQRGAAERALRKGLKSYPRDGAFGLALGRLLWEERDADGAIAVLARVPRGARRAEAQALLRQVREAQAQERNALRQAKALERRMARARPGGGGSGPAPVGATGASGLTYESGEGPGGMRTRSNSRFVLKYFNNARDFGQRAEYEGRVVAALDEAHQTARRVLGHARESAVDVVLYTREEFTMHFSESTARKVAGLYFGDSIRINDAAELTQRAKATLVHEYIHAVVDELAGGQASRLPTWLNEGLAEYVEWRYLGSESPPYAIAVSLRAAARTHRVPQLARMDRGALVNGTDPAEAYATSAVAVKLLLKEGGPEPLLQLIREVGQGQPFEPALQARYGRSLARLQEELEEALSGGG